MDTLVDHRNCGLRSGGGGVTSYERQAFGGGGAEGPGGVMVWWIIDDGTVYEQLDLRYVIVMLVRPDEI